MSTLSKSSKQMIEIGEGLYIHEYYDPNKVPADWEAAARHAQACQPGLPLINQQKRVLCSCCMNQIHKTPVPYCESMKELAYLGAGFPLFYNFLKFCIIMLAALLADNCILSAYTNYQQNDCVNSNPYCVYGAANSVSYVASASVTIDRQLMACISFIVQLILLVIMRMTQNALTIYYDERTCKISDFTLRVKYIPKGYKNNKQKLTALIKRKCPEVTVMNILLVYDSDEFELKIKKLHQISDLKAQQKKFNQKEETIMMRILNSQYDQAAVDVAEIAKNFDEDQGDYFTGMAFITVNSKIEREVTKKGIEQATPEEIAVHFLPLKVGEKHSQLVARPARQPNEINWHNIHRPKKVRTFAFIKGWILSTLFLAAITIIFFFLIKARSHYIEVSATAADSDHEIGIFLGYFTILLIVLFNKFLFPPVCHWLTHLELHTNYNEEEFSFALKYMLAVFFTTALMTLVVQTTLYHNYYGLFGVVEAESYVFVLNGFIPPIVWAINPFFLIAQWKKNRNLKRQDLTQKEVNQLVEYPHYSMGKRYAEIIKTMWFTFLYAWLIPLGAVFSLVGLILYYFVDKYVLLRKSSLQVSISSHLSNFMLFLLDFTLIMKPLGQLFFDTNLRKQSLTTTIIMIIIASIYILLPLNKILKAMFPEKQMDYRFTYEQMREVFINTYENVCPLNKSRRLASRIGIMMTSKNYSSLDSQRLNQTQRTLSPLSKQHPEDDSRSHYNDNEHSTRPLAPSKNSINHDNPSMEDFTRPNRPKNQTQFYDPRLIPFMPNMNPNYGKVTVVNPYQHHH